MIQALPSCWDKEVISVVTSLCAVMILTLLLSSLEILQSPRNYVEVAISLNSFQNMRQFLFLNVRWDNFHSRSYLTNFKLQSYGLLDELTLVAIQNSLEKILTEILWKGCFGVTSTNWCESLTFPLKGSLMQDKLTCFTELMQWIILTLFYENQSHEPLEITFVNS